MANCIFPVPIQNGFIINTNTATRRIVQDTNGSKDVWTLHHGTDERVHFDQPVAENYFSGDVTVTVYWRASTNTGDVYWFPRYAFFPTGTRYASVSMSSAIQVVTVPGTAGNVKSTTFTFSTGVGANRMCLFYIGRDGTQVQDTCMGTVDIMSMEFSYACDPTIAKVYRWIPAAAFWMPSSTSAYKAEVGNDVTSITHPMALLFPDDGAAVADFHTVAPANTFGSPTVWHWGRNESHNAAQKFRLDAARYNVGNATDPALTTGTSVTIAAPGNDYIATMDSQLAFPVSIGGNDSINGRLFRDNSDANTTIVSCWGLLVGFPISATANAMLFLDPVAGSAPTTNGATFLQVGDTNTTKGLAQFADTGGDVIADYARKIPGNYAAGGTLKWRWRTATASTNSAVFEVFTASPSNTSPSDPTLTSIGTVTTANSGNNTENQSSLDISAGVLVDDEEMIRMVRKSGTDTLAATVEIFEMWFEASAS